MDKIVVLTGAGMSADSGLQTFRDSDGLWEGHDINEVATIEAWNRNPGKVLQFYNARRHQAHQAKPNAGHRALAKLETVFEVTIITQNVDCLHERAGSSRVVHLHGELSKVRSVKDASLIKDIGGQAINIGDKAEDGAQWRPHVVWFGEMVPMMEVAMEIIPQADMLFVIGTSLVVYPAAGLIYYARAGITKYIIDPAKPDLDDEDNWNHIQAKAKKGVPLVVNSLIKECS